MAAYLVALRRYDESRGYAREALPLTRDVQDEGTLVCTLQHLAAVAALRPNDDVTYTSDDRRRAAQLLGYTDARLSALDALREYTEQQEYDKMLAALRDARCDCILGRR